MVGFVPVWPSLGELQSTQYVGEEDWLSQGMLRIELEGEFEDRNSIK